MAERLCQVSWLHREFVLVSNALDYHWPGLIQQINNGEGLCINQLGSHYVASF